MSNEKPSSSLLTQETTQPSTSTQANAPARTSSNRRSFLKRTIIAGAPAVAAAPAMMVRFKNERRLELARAGELDCVEVEG